MKVGVLTFHSAHNNGSVLQAYATQKAIEILGYDCEIINFRLTAQEDFYSLYRNRFGKKNYLYDRLLLPFHRQRKEKWNKFEKFINNYMKLSGLSVYERTDLKEISRRYDVFISGSDQIWNNNVAELRCGEKDYTGVYYFDFLENEKLISYASSVGNMKNEDIAERKELLDKYLFLSTREECAREVLQKLLNRDVSLVVDPTFLLDGNEWGRLCSNIPLVKEKYVLLYSLGKPRNLIEWGNNLKIFAENNNLKVVSLNTFFPVMVPGVKNILNAGPLDFLNLFRFADVICTDTFHGTAFSINFRKPFYALGNKYYKDDIRKNEVLKRFGLTDRIIQDEAELSLINSYSIDYSRAEKLIETDVQNSIEYLKKTLMQTNI